jgi:hypothetical protein
MMFYFNYRYRVLKCTWVLSEGPIFVAGSVASASDRPVQDDQRDVGGENQGDLF